jgi:hypothetical protein
MNSCANIQSLLKMVIAVPSAYLYEYAIVIDELYHVKISTSRILQIFEKHGINRKKVEKGFCANFSCKKKLSNATPSCEMLGI